MPRSRMRPLAILVVLNTFAQRTEVGQPQMRFLKVFPVTRVHIDHGHHELHILDSMYLVNILIEIREIKTDFFLDWVSIRLVSHISFSLSEKEKHNLISVHLRRHLAASLQVAFIVVHATIMGIRQQFYTAETVFIIAACHIFFAGNIKFAHSSSSS